MSTQRLATVFFVAALCSVSFLSGAGQWHEELPTQRDESYVPLLCPLLENLQRGDSVEVIVSGIYRVGPESSVLFDPNTPLCNLDVQPTIWVEFADGVMPTELENLLDTYQYAAVTFRGRLDGPGAHGSAKPDLPMWMEFADRYLGRRYGHLNAYRAKLLVTEVVDAWKAPTHQALSYVRHRPPSPPLPEVESTRVPYYPPRALAVGISGSVTFRVEVQEGAVHSISHRTGNRVLAAGAREVIESWTFDSSFTGSFLSTFTFRLEKRRTGEDASPELRMRLPSDVEVVAPRNLW